VGDIGKPIRETDRPAPVVLPVPEPAPLREPVPAQPVRAPAET